MTALILFAHGARDPRWAGPFLRLRDRLQQQRPETEIKLAFLEFMQPDLATVFAELSQQDIKHAVVVPIFLGQGGHVLRELPGLIEAGHKLYPELQIRLVDAVGECDTVLAAIADYCLTELTRG